MADVLDMSGLSPDDLKRLADAQDEHPELPPEEILRQYREFKASPVPVTSSEYSPPFPANPNEPLTNIARQAGNFPADLWQNLIKPFIPGTEAAQGMGEGLITLAKSIVPGTSESEAMGKAMMGAPSAILERLKNPRQTLSDLAMRAVEKPATTMMDISVFAPPVMRAGAGAARLAEEMQAGGRGAVAARILRGAEGAAPTAPAAARAAETIVPESGIMGAAESPVVGRTLPVRTPPQPFETALRTEMTPAGEQFLIPGTEARTVPRTAIQGGGAGLEGTPLAEGAEATASPPGYALTPTSQAALERLKAENPRLEPQDIQRLEAYLAAQEAELGALPDYHRDFVMKLLNERRNLLSQGQDIAKMAETTPPTGVVGRTLANIIKTKFGGANFHKAGLTGELQDVPKHLYMRGILSKKGGTSADVVTDFLRTNYPEFGIQTESDLLQVIRAGGERLFQPVGGMSYEAKIEESQHELRRLVEQLDDIDDSVKEAYQEAKVPMPEGVLPPHGLGFKAPDFPFGGLADALEGGAKVAEQFDPFRLTIAGLRGLVGGGNKVLERLRPMLAMETGQSPGEFGTIERTAKEGGAAEKALVAQLKGQAGAESAQTMGQAVENSINSRMRGWEQSYQKTLLDYVRERLPGARLDPNHPDARMVQSLQDAVSGKVSPLKFWNERVKPALENLRLWASRAYTENMAQVPDNPVMGVVMKGETEETLRKFGIVSPTDDLPNLDFSKSRLSDVPSGVRGVIQDLWRNIEAREGDTILSLDMFKQQMDEKYRAILGRMKSPTGKAVIEGMLQSIRSELADATEHIPQYGLAQKAWRDQKAFERALDTDMSFGASSIETPYKKIMGVIDHPENDIRTVLTQQIQAGMPAGENLQQQLETLEVQERMSQLFKQEGRNSVADILTKAKQGGEATADDLSQIDRVAQALMSKGEYAKLLAEHRNRQQMARNILNRATGVYTGSWRDRGENVGKLADLLNNPSDEAISQEIIRAIQQDNPHISEKFAGLNAHTIMGRSYFARRVLLGAALGIPLYYANPILPIALVSMSPRAMATVIRGGAKAENVLRSMASYAPPVSVLRAAVMSQMARRPPDRDSTVVSSRPLSKSEVRRRILGQ